MKFTTRISAKHAFVKPPQEIKGLTMLEFLEASYQQKAEEGMDRLAWVGEVFFKEIAVKTNGLYVGEQKVESLIFSQDEWLTFANALVTFARPPATEVKPGETSQLYKEENHEA